MCVCVCVPECVCVPVWNCLRNHKRVCLSPESMPNSCLYTIQSRCTLHLQVIFSGAVITADLFASGVYTVRAKVPNAPGVRWAMWLYHNEYHIPRDCK